MQVEQLLLSEPNNQEYEDLYNSITEVSAPLLVHEYQPSFVPLLYIAS